LAAQSLFSKASMRSVTRRPLTSCCWRARGVETSRRGHLFGQGIKFVAAISIKMKWVCGCCSKLGNLGRMGQHHPQLQVIECSTELDKSHPCMQGPVLVQRQDSKWTMLDASRTTRLSTVVRVPAYALPATASTAQWRGTCVGRPGSHRVTCNTERAASACARKPCWFPLALD